MSYSCNYQFLPKGIEDLISSYTGKRPEWIQQERELLVREMKFIFNHNGDNIKELINHNKYYRSFYRSNSFMNHKFDDVLLHIRLYDKIIFKHLTLKVINRRIFKKVKSNDGDYFQSLNLIM